MAKKKTKATNKSQAIRDYYQANPNAKPKEVAESLKKSGITVTPAFVSTIRSTSKNKKKPIKKTKRKTGRSNTPSRVSASKSGRGRPKAARGKASAGEQAISIDSLLRVKKMVEEMGGIDETRVALSALEKLLA